MPIKSAGKRSGVNCSRWKPVWMQAAIVLTVSVFAKTGHAFEQDVAVGEQAEQKPVDQIFLADDDVPDLLAQRRDPLPQLLHLLGDFLR